MCKPHHLTTQVKIENSKRRQSFKCWLSQARKIACERGPVNNYFIPSGLTFKISIWYPSDNLTLRGTFMADIPPRNIYLFIFPPRVEWIKGYAVINIPAAADAFYWSLDPLGRTRLSPDMAEDLDAPHVFFEAWVVGL